MAISSGPVHLRTSVFPKHGDVMEQRTALMKVMRQDVSKVISAIYDLLITGLVCGDNL